MYTGHIRAQAELGKALELSGPVVRRVSTCPPSRYKAHAEGIRKRGWAAAVWDDGGFYQLYDRAQDSWDQPVLTALLGGDAEALVV